MRTRVSTIKVTRRRYQCSICKSWDSSKNRIQRCEKLAVEKKFFKVGDLVTGFSRTASGGSKVYKPQKARVAKFCLEARDFRGFFDHESVMHRWVYELRWRCPLSNCETLHSDLFVYGVLKSPYISDGKYYPGVLKKVT